MPPKGYTKKEIVKYIEEIKERREWGGRAYKEILYNFKSKYFLLVLLRTSKDDKEPTALARLGSYREIVKN